VVVVVTRGAFTKSDESSKLNTLNMLDKE